MDDFLISDEAVDKMNDEYARVLPAHLKALSGKAPFALQKKPDSAPWDVAERGLRALHAYFSDYADRRSFLPVSEIIQACALRLRDAYFAHFGKEPVWNSAVPTPCEAFCIACEVYLVLPTPENAVTMSAIALTVK